MSQCWPEGALRAHLDHELPPEDMQSLAAHLAGCAKCAGISRQLAARAARVALLMDEVSPGLVLIGAPMHATPGSRVGRAPQTRPLVARRQWIGLAAALAAGVAAAALMLPRHKTVVPVPPAAATLLPQPASIAEAANPGNPRSLTSTAAVPKRIRQSRARPPAAGAVLPGRDLRRGLKS